MVGGLMASDETEAQFLPRVTAAVREAVAWFLDRVGPRANQAAPAAAEGRPFDLVTGMPTQRQFTDELFEDLQPVLGEVFDDGFWDGLDDLGETDTSVEPYTPAELSPTGEEEGGSLDQVYGGTEAQERQVYLASVHDRLSKSQWAPGVYDEIRHTLMQSVDEGWTLDETTDAIAPILDPDGAANRAWIETVAVSEIHSAYAAGTYQAAIAEGQHNGGVMPTLQWIATRDERTRPTHVAANGQRVEAGQPFIVGGAPLRFPGDPFGPPGETIRCRCSIGVFHADDPVTASGGPAMDRHMHWEGPLAPLDTMTADRRLLAAPTAEARTRPLPLPLLYQRSLAPEHDGAIDVGVIDTVDVRDGQLWGTGRFDTSNPEAADVARRVAEGFLGWVSVDLDDATYELAYDQDGEPYDSAADWRLMGATLVPHPAFADGAKIHTIDPAGSEEDAVPVTADCSCSPSETTYAAPPFPPKADAAPKSSPPGGSGDKPDQAGAAAPWSGKHLVIKLGDQTWDLEFTADSVKVDGAELPLEGAKPGDSDDEFTVGWTNEDGTKVTADLDLAEGKADGELTADDGTVTEVSGTVKDADAKDDDEDTKPKDQAPAKDKAPAKGKNPFPPVAAAAGPLAPPAEWFENPRLDGPTPVTITDDGRVYGHLAAWKTNGADTCHTGSRPGTCTTVPHSSYDYAYFHVGAMRVDDGRDIAVGNLIVDTDHAAMSADYRTAGAHYAHTGAAVAAVRAGEDEHGIWVSGSVLPHVTDEQIATLRRAPLSGDWRAIGGNLELVAALAVNTPGFPVPRARVDEYARTASLTAAGALVHDEDKVTTASVAAEVVRRLDERDAERATRARHMAALSLRDGVQSAVKASRQARAQRFAKAAKHVRRHRAARMAKAVGVAGDDGKESSPAGDGGVELTEDDVAFIADVLGLDATDVQVVELTEDEVAEILAMLTAEDADDADSDGELLAAHAPARDGVQDALNWVDDVGGLPDRVRRVAKHLIAKGFTKSHAIATAVNQVKKWCANPNSKADNRAKSCAAVADWERKKAQAHAA